MQTLKDLEAQRDAINKQIEDLKNQSWPNVGDKYYYVDSYGAVGSHRNDGLFVDDGAQAIGNMFRTEDEANSQLYAMKVIAELRRQPGRKSFKACKHNHCVMVSIDTPEVYVDSWNNIDSGWQSIYFESEEAANQATYTVGAERIIKAAKWLAMGEVITD